MLEFIIDFLMAVLAMVGVLALAVLGRMAWEDWHWSRQRKAKEEQSRDYEAEARDYLAVRDPTLCAEMLKAFDKMGEERPCWLIVNSDNCCGWRARWGRGELSTNADSLLQEDVSASDIATAIECVLLMDWGEETNV